MAAADQGFEGFGWGDMSEDHLVVTWKEIHKLLKIQGSDKYLCSLPTLITRYGPELKRTGVVFEWHLGKGKRPVIACWPSIFKQWFMIRQQKKHQGNGDCK